MPANTDLSRQAEQIYTKKASNTYFNGTNIIIAIIHFFYYKIYITDIYKNLKQLKKEKSLTQDDLASDKISRSMISLIEIAKNDLTVLKK